MQFTGQFIKEKRHAVRFIGARRYFNQSRPFGQFFGNRKLGRVRQQRQICRLQFRVIHCDTRFTGAAQHAAYARMGVLDVEHRIFTRLLKHFVEIKIQRRIIFARQHHKAGDICAHLINYIAQSDKCPCPLGHFKRFAIFIKTHQLGQFYLKRYFAI